MPVRIMKTLRVVVVVAVATGILVFLLMPGESDGGKTKKGPLVTEKVSLVNFCGITCKLACVSRFLGTLSIAKCKRAHVK